MAFRISPLWWPTLGIASPLILPMLIKKNRQYIENLITADNLNEERIRQATSLDLPELDFLELTVLVEEKHKDGFLGDAGVSYLLRSDQGALLFDIGFGPDRPALEHNASRLDFNLDKVDALVISHLHPDHMGGMKASRLKSVIIPKELGSPNMKPCFLPGKARAEGFKEEVVEKPTLLPGGMATTGPLARSLFFFGLTEEQAIVARVKNKGLIVIVGCSHPTIEIILKMSSILSNEPLHTVGGGLHFPVTQGRGNRLGIQIQMIVGTGFPPWRPLNTDDLENTIEALNKAAPKQVLLSAHDICDYSLSQMDVELKAHTDILRAGNTYRF